MRKSLCWLLLLLILFPGQLSAGMSAADAAWQPVAPGIEYSKFRLPESNNVFVTRMDRSKQDVTIDSSIGQGKLYRGWETVSEMYSRYDQALNYGNGSNGLPIWGVRNQVVVAINGGYFQYNQPFAQGGLINSGWYARRFDNVGGWTGFAWKLDRTAFIGECVYHRPEKQFVSYSSGVTQEITATNSSSVMDELVLFTPQFDSTTRTGNSVVEAVVEMTRPTMVLPEPAFASGIVRQVREGAGNTLIPFNSIVLSAMGTARQVLIQNAIPGSEVHISQEITSYESNCETPLPSISWTKTYASVQGAFYFLENGQTRHFDDPGATSLNPRTAIAFNSQYVFFIVVDGRSFLSVGMSIDDLGVFARDVLGATYAVAEDGGGSSTMVVNGTVMNDTICNQYFCEHFAFMPMVKKIASGEQSIPLKDDDQASITVDAERAVANGLMMVVVQPEQFSTTFVPGQPVNTIVDTVLFLGPGTNYTGIIAVPSGSSLTIMNQMNGLNGVLAKGTYWWYVNYAGLPGWVPEGALSNR